jgi:hypothetical protein
MSTRLGYGLRSTGDAMPARLSSSGQRWRATLASGDAHRDGPCIGVSAEGICVKLASAPPADEVVGVTLCVPGAGEFAGRARVVKTCGAGCLELRWTVTSMRLAWFLDALRRAREGASECCRDAMAPVTKLGESTRALP